MSNTKTYFVIKSGNEYLSKFILKDDHLLNSYEDTFTEFDFQRTFVYDTFGKALRKLKATKAKGCGVETIRKHYELMQEKLSLAKIIEVKFDIKEINKELEDE